VLWSIAFMFNKEIGPIHTSLLRQHLDELTSFHISRHQRYGREDERTVASYLLCVLRQVSPCTTLASMRGSSTQHHLLHLLSLRITGRLALLDLALPAV
jgi:hypothetical protein